MITLERLEDVLRTLPRLTIGLVGDLFLDRYLELVPGSSELSIETGLEAYQIGRVRNSPGALGTVLSNLAALGVGLLVPVSVIGDDGHGYDLLKELRRLPVDPTNVLPLADRLTPTYTKPLRQSAAGPWQELNRLDVRTRQPLSAAATAEVCRRVEQVFRSSDGLIVLDQLVDENCGVVNAEVRETLARLAQEQPQKLIYVDSRRFLGKFAAGTLKGNRAEILHSRDQWSRSSIDDDIRLHSRDQWSRSSIDDEVLAQTLADLARQTNRPAFCTVGEQGILVALPGQEPRIVAGYPATGPTDIVGAGDAATSGIVTALLAGCSELEAASMGNLVASITVRQIGTTGTASPAQLRARWHEVRNFLC
ncbi:MAG: PfkB family carbohydrate kinase [Pirellulaceae bacterium]